MVPSFFLTRTASAAHGLVEVCTTLCCNMSAMFLLGQNSFKMEIKQGYNWDEEENTLESRLKIALK